MLSFQDRAYAVSAEDLATRDGEIAFGQAWLKNTRERLYERVDPFVLMYSKRG